MQNATLPCKLQQRQMEMRGELTQMLFLPGVTRVFAEEASDTHPHMFLELFRLRKGFFAAGS